MQKFLKSLMAASFIFIFSVSLFAAGETPDTAQVDNALAQGYTAVQKNQDDAAIRSFTEAGSLARRQGDWQGLIDAGYGLAALGKTAEALPLFNDAVNAAKQDGAVPGLIGAAYALASLPENMNTLGLAVEALDEAMKMVQATQDAEGAKTLAKAYQDLGRSDKAAQAQSLAARLAQAGGEETRGVTTPPPGWSPVGESIKGPKKVPVEVQQLNRQSADRDISSKMEYIKRSEELEQRERERRTRLAEAYSYYQGYYGYPGGGFGINDFGLYGFGRHQITVIQRRHWATTQLSYFSPYGGFLIRIDRHRHRHWH